MPDDQPPGGNAADDTPTADATDGDDPTGDNAADDTPTGDDPTGDDPTGDGPGTHTEEQPVPDFVAARDRVLDALVGFVRVLRDDGAAVPANAAQDAASALAVVGLQDREAVATALRAALLTRPADADRFDEHFPEFWSRLRAGIEGAVAADRAASGSDEAAPEEWSRLRRNDEPPSGTSETSEDGDVDGGESGTVVTRLGGASDEDLDEVETDRRPGSYSAAGRRTQADATAVPGGPPVRESDLRSFEQAIASLRGRRYRRGAGATVDRRRALRRSLGTGGVPVVLPTRSLAETAFRTTVLVDVSRSVVDAVDRDFLLAVLARLSSTGRSTRTFFFDTDLRDVSDVFTDASAREDPSAALERAAVEWGGGTKIGAAIETLRRAHRDAVDRRTVVLVISDGLDVGELDDLESGMAWLARRSRAVLWLNPLAASPAYEPTARGMATALPYVDGLFAFTESADLAEAARQLEHHGLGGPLGYQYDTRRATDAGRS